MTPQEKKQTLIQYLNMKVLEGDWHGVSDAANDLREIEVAIRLGASLAHTEILIKDIPPQAIPPVDIEIVHHVNEVASLLKLNDEQLVDKMFPDYSELQEKSE